MAGYIGSKSSVTLVDGYTEAEADAEFVNDPSSVITVSGSNVGIGTGTPSAKLELSSSATDHLRLTRSTNNWDVGVGSTGALITKLGGADIMRITSDGVMLVGTIDELGANETSETGHDQRPDGTGVQIRDGNTVQYFNRLTSNGDIIDFRSDGVNVGAIGVGSSLYIDGGSQQAGLQFRGSDIVPRDNGALVDGSVDLGDGAYRFDDAYIKDGVVTGSDENDKHGITELTATEMLVASRLSQTFRTYKWNKAVALKGDNARTHTGTVAQEVQAAFTAEGLDAGDYAMFMSNTWWTHDVEVPAVEAVAEVTDEDGNITTEAVEAVDAYTRTDTYYTEAEAPSGATSKTRLGIRYTELLCFVGAYNEQRFASIEARLTALEA
jgi:hypothetical protein